MIINKEGKVDVLLALVIFGFISSMILFFVGGSETILFSAIILLILVVILGVLDTYLHLFSKPRKFKRKLNALNKLLTSGNIDKLKKVYEEAFRLSSKGSGLNSVREKLGELIRVSKKLETLLDKSDKGTLKVRKKRFHEILELREKLPAGEREKYSSQVMLIKDGLEKGK